ncbi:SDR family oxidoreductase [Nitrososphaera sp.]|uniref:NAD-dependent epimerase/dehydratase family protein n=1 Tax=Nitrososphaera sp. TaxID=1971748 RepID=UPI00317E8A6E
MTETVLVLGGAGYIGTALVARLLRDTKFNVRVLDDLMYGGDSLLPYFNFKERFSFIRGDIRKVDPTGLLRGVDYVVNVAALVGEPICKKFPVEATQINLDANIRMAEASERAGVKQFVFSSTCSNYGLSKSDELIDEAGELQPISLYAETKVQSEQKLLHDFKKMKVTVLRFATAYGLASRVRFDLLLHEFIRDAWKKKKIVVYGAESWRPMVHVDDIARGIITVLGNNKDGAEVYNVGSNNQNFRKIELANIVAKRLGAEIESLPTIKDPRNYKVSFDKISKKFGYNTLFDPVIATDQIAGALETGVIDDRILFESVNVKQEG